MRISCSVLLGSVACLMTLFTWLGGGIVAPWLTPWTPWMTLLLAEVMLILPEQHRNETLFDARRRVWRSVVRDPLTWCTLLLTVFLVIQWLNGMTFIEWEPTSRTWELRSPVVESWADPKVEPYLADPVPRALQPRSVAAQRLSFPNSQPFKGLPWSYRSDEAWGVLNWFPPVLVALLAVRHALRKRSKRYLCSFICLMTIILSLAGLVQYILEEDFLYWGLEGTDFFFATFGYPNHAACYFPAVMLLSIGMLLWTFEHREHTRMPPWIFALAAILCAVSAILSGSRAGMLFTLAVTGFSAVYIPFRYSGSLPKRWRIVFPVGIFVVALAVIGTAFFRVHAVEANRSRVAALAAVTKEQKKVAVQQARVAALEALTAMEVALERTSAALAQPISHSAHAVALTDAATVTQAAMEAYHAAQLPAQASKLQGAVTQLRQCSGRMQRAITGAAQAVECKTARATIETLHTLIATLDAKDARATVGLARAEADGAKAEVETRMQTVSAMPAYMTIPALDKVLEEIYDTDWEALFENPMLMRSGYQGILALRQLDAHPWFGAGAHSFRWLNYKYIDPTNPEEKDWYKQRLGVGQANVHNDTLQFLAEHGWVGFGLMCSCVLMLVGPFFVTLFTSPKYGVSDTWADRCWLNRLNAYAVFAFLATALIAFHSFFDLVFRSAACMLLYGLLFVCAPGFILGAPRTKNSRVG